MNRRILALSLAALVPLGFTVSPVEPWSGPRPAEAAVAMLISLDELVAVSSYVVVATPSEQHSAWEDLPGGRRIVTYTKLTIDRSVVGAPGGEMWVRTLGGVVGNIGQAVSGEAQLFPGKKSLLFLAKTNEAVVVTALAQGHYPILASATKGEPERLSSSPDAGTLLPRRGPSISAREQLLGATVDGAIAAIVRARKANDAKK